LLTAERERAVFRDTNTWFHTQPDHDDWRRVAWVSCGKFATTWVTAMPDSTTSLPNYAVTYACLGSDVVLSGIAGWAPRFGR
jgi:hypothetical protein